MSIGVPGCPELAAWTASIDSVRIVLMQSSSIGLFPAPGRIPRAAVAPGTTGGWLWRMVRSPLMACPPVNLRWPRASRCHLCSSRSLARLPGLAERPERNPEQGQVLDEELPRERRQGGEAAETRLPDARRGDEE